MIVRSQITGQIVKINFVQGQTVKKGEFGQIDPCSISRATRPGDRELRPRSGASGERESIFTRYTDLAKQKSIAQQLADLQKAIVAQLVAMIKADEAIIQSAQSEFSLIPI